MRTSVAGRFRGGKAPVAAAPLLIVVLLLLAATGCGAAAEPTPTAPQTGEVKRGGIFRTSAGEDPVNFDPMLQTSVRNQQRVGGSYNRLYRFSFYEMGVLEPDLAEKFEVSSDGLTYTFTLRSGVKFHKIEGVPGSGTDLDCADVKHSLDKYRNPEQSKKASDLIAVDTIQCDPANPLKVVFKLRQSDAGLVSMLSAGWASIFPSELPWEDLKTTVIGTGPFIWKSYTKAGKSVTERNPEYWRKGFPYLDGVENIVFPREEVGFTAFRAKQLDMNSYMQYIYPAEASILKANHPEVTVSLLPRLWWHGIEGQWDKPPWNDIRVRQAFNLALNRPRAVEILGQGVGDYGGWQPPWTSWSLPRAELDQYVGKADGSDMPARIEKAKKLLQEAGYTSGLKLKLMAANTREGMSTPQYVQDQLKAVGVELTLEPLDTATLTDRQDRRDFDLKSGGGTAGVINPSLFYGNFFLCKAPANYSNYCDKDFDALYAAQLSEPNEAKRREIVWQMERKVLTDLPRVPVRYVSEGMAWWPWVKNFHDVDPGYYNNVTMEEVWLDRDHPGYPK